MHRRKSWHHWTDRYRQAGEGENVRFHQLGAVDNVRYVKTGEGENVRPVKKMRWQMTAYALFDEGENVRDGKCPVTLKDSLLSFHTDFSFFSQRVPLFIKHYRCFTFFFFFHMLTLTFLKARNANDAF